MAGHLMESPDPERLGAHWDHELVAGRAEAGGFRGTRFPAAVTARGYKLGSWVAACSFLNYSVNMNLEIVSRWKSRERFPGSWRGKCPH